MPENYFINSNSSNNTMRNQRDFYPPTNNYHNNDMFETFSNDTDMFPVNKPNKKRVIEGQYADENAIYVKKEKKNSYYESDEKRINDTNDLLHKNKIETEIKDIFMEDNLNTDLINSIDLPTKIEEDKKR